MKLRTLTLSLIGLTFALTSIHAQGRHPAYLRARSDLRRAQFLLRAEEGPNMPHGFRDADHELEAAIHEIDQAAVLDRKDLDEHPPVDTRIDRRGRFHKIVELLRSAHADLSREEDNGRAVAWRNAANHYLDEALENVHIVAVQLHWEHELGF